MYICIEMTETQLLLKEKDTEYWSQLFELITLLILFLADNLVWVPLMDEIKQLFGISAASTLNNAEEEIESDEVESESS
jgi:hypothetical protein